MRMIAFALAFLGLPGLATATGATDVFKLRKLAKDRKELEVYGHVNIDDYCESKGPVEIELDIPPKGGTVCMRPGFVRLRYTWSGGNQHCIGRRIKGVFVIYVPFARSSGRDTLQYTARTDPSQTRTYAAEIKVEAAEALTPGAASPLPQKPGPMPACAALVS
jgi:hypothetical protein